MAFLSNLLTLIDMLFAYLTYSKYIFPNWMTALDKWDEGSANLTKFLFQITILGFCWVYATRPRPHESKIEDDQIEVEETQPDEHQEITEAEILYALDLELRSDSDDKLDQEAKEQREMLKRQMMRTLSERNSPKNQSQDDDENHQGEQTLLLYFKKEEERLLEQPALEKID